ncbi:uncharacterized protein LOC143277979 [Babylonia areolata]|uniref:uncharacterized protein LOC143277979 n=1 Tax=Babylonia areolata TaxID=304850 RepID=UPI003FD07BDD
MAMKNRTTLTIRGAWSDEVTTLLNGMLLNRLSLEDPRRCGGEAQCFPGCGHACWPVDPAEDMRRFCPRPAQYRDSVDTGCFYVSPSEGKGLGLLGVTTREGRTASLAHSSPPQLEQQALHVAIAESGLSSKTRRVSSVQAVVSDDDSLTVDSDLDLKRMRHAEKLHMKWDQVPSQDSSCSPGHTLDFSSSGSEENCSDNSGAVYDLGQNQEGCASLSGADCEGLRYGTQERLLEFVEQLPRQPKDSGICAWNVTCVITTRMDKGVLKYEENKDFVVKKDLHQSRKYSGKYGVFLCQDLRTTKQFILKKIESTNNRLVGLEFLVRHPHRFLPKIHAVYKEHDVIWIFEEFIDGVMVKECAWNLQQLYRFSCSLLSALHFLHDNQVAHCDIKLENVLVRDPQQPESVVLIDFESAKSPEPCYHYLAGGHTINYLPFWHQEMSSVRFEGLLMAADLWAVACLLLPFLSSSPDSDTRRPAVWTDHVNKVLHSCPNFKNKTHGRVFCKDHCRKRFLTHLTKDGEKILEVHLKGMLHWRTDNVTWLRLLELLKYLTSSSRDSRHKDVHTALRILHRTD